ncbi:MAG: efflux transporter outer membrane subunit [Pseudomonadota bacterium]
MNCAQTLRTALIAYCALLLPACVSLGPDYSEPSVEWLSGWQPELYGQLDSDPDALGDELSSWWLRFDDAQLNTLLREVRSNNLDLQVAALRVLEARARLLGANALRLPQSQQASASAAYLRTRQSEGLLPASNSSLGSYSAGIAAGWELDFWGRFQRAIESAGDAYLASIAEQRDIQVLLTAQTVDVYFSYRTTKERLRIAQNNAAIQRRSFAITQQLFESGQESELDFQQAKTQYLATLAQLPVLEQAVVELRNALTLLLGRPPGEVAELAGEESLLPKVEPAALTGVPVQLLLRRPDVRAAAWSAGAQSAQIGIAAADFYPSISLLGSFGWTGDSIGETRDGASFAIGPSVRWNIFDYGRIRANLLVQDARLEQALLGYESVLLAAAREIDNAAVAVIKTAQAQSVLHDSRVAAERALEIANRRYREGYADFQRVLDAQRALFSQADRELQNQGAHLSSVVSLYRSLGGGWESQGAGGGEGTALQSRVVERMSERNDWGELLSESTSDTGTLKASK